MTSLISSGLLAASMLLGQQGDAPANNAKPAIVQTTPAPTRPILGWLQREDRPVINRIQSWFKRDHTDAQPTGKTVPPRNGAIRETEQPPLIKQPTSNDFPRRMPNPTSQAPATSEPIAKETPTVPPIIQQASTKPEIVPPTNAKSPIMPHLANKIGRDERFEWITGQFEIENGNFVLYYATPETIDKYNGRIVLSPNQADLSQFRKGDLVSVRGQLVQRPIGQSMIPIYRVSHASLIK
ncbi:MAG: hypothetical protein HYR84_08350 [Planctomycetes bacterium]|nr:hypothetical protein [Planctomycetota bacterium]